jgi:tetratricopeptide (TPR) repeat protein
MPATDMPKHRFIPFLLPAFLSGLLWLPPVGLAAPELPKANELQEKAQQAYTEGRYAEAEAINLEIAEKHPRSPVRRYAVLMLGSLYENNLVDLTKAMKWYREYLDEYADPRQGAFYREKLDFLEKLTPQENAFAKYQAIRFADAGDKVAVEKYEALLAEHPDFLLKASVLKELGYAYARLDKLRQSYRAFEALSRIGGEEFSASDRLAYGKASRHWHQTAAWAGIAWAVVAILWAAVLFMNPWGRMTWASIGNFWIWPFLWLLLAAVRMPSYFAIEEENLFPDAAVYIAAGLNVAVLFWLLLLTRGKFWQTRPRALLWLSPVLTLLMTLAVSYLFLFHQPNGAVIIDAFADKYRHCAEAPRNPGTDQLAGPEKSK